MRQPREAAPPARGILRLPDETAGHVHQRMLPGPELCDFVEHFWCVSWALATPQLVETLSHPSVHVVFESTNGQQRAEVAGVPRARFSRTLTGTGSVFGIKFRPATFRALVDVPLHRLTGQVLPLREVLGDAALALERTLFACPHFEARAQCAERFLAARGLRLSPATKRLRNLIESIARDPDIVRVEQLATIMRVDRRTLERRFRDDVGVTPKWVIRRYRLHEAAERLRRGDALIEVAHALGYADQAHFSRDFKVEVGETPLAFVRRQL